MGCSCACYRGFDVHDPGHDDSAPDHKSTLGPCIGHPNLSSYQTDNDGRHLRLGITLQGFVLFLLEIGFLHSKEELNWTNEGHLVQSVNGALEYSHGRSGYDLCKFLRTWLPDMNAASLSVCELILTSSRFESIRHHVSLAKVFWSHLQAEDVIGHPGAGTIGLMNRAIQISTQCFPSLEGPFVIWIDYMSLRQCCHDFSLPRILQLIPDIGYVFQAAYFAGNIKEYLSRSFCIFEMFAAVNSGTRMGSAVLITRTQLEAKLMPGGAIGPVRSELANTRNREDKEQIDNYIRNGVGHVDKVVTEVMLAACDHINAVS